MAIFYAKIRRSVADHKNFTYFLCALIVSFVCTYITWPGVFFVDTYNRWDFAHRVLMNGGVGTVSWYGFVPSIFMAVCFYLTGSYGFYTFVQSFALLFSCLLLVDRFTQHCKLVAALLVLNPIIVAYSVLGDVSVGSMIGLNWLLLLLLWQCNIQRTSKRMVLIFFCLCLLLCFIIFGYRQNAITLLPIICLFCVLQGKRQLEWPKWLLVAVASVLAAMLAAICPTMLHVKDLNNASASFVWETLSTINRLPDEQRESYIDYYDDIAGEGATLQALDVNRQDNESVNPFMPYLTQRTIGAPENGWLIVHRYFNLALCEPNTFIANKLEFAGRVMGIPQPVKNLAYDYNVLDRMGDFGMVDSPLRVRVIDLFNSFMYRITVFRLPWIWFLLGGTALIAHRVVTGRFGQGLWLFALAVFYYDGFLLNNQSYEFRYFFVWSCPRGLYQAQS